MKTTPKSLRLHIGLLGRMNVGKSSFLNMIAGQDVAITSNEPGTTTDIVEKPMELHSLGPVVFLDTAGIDDESRLGNARRKKTYAAIERSDVMALITEPDIWTSFEEHIAEEARKNNIPLILVVNKIDCAYPSESFVNRLKKVTNHIILCSSIEKEQRLRFVNELERCLQEIGKGAVCASLPLIADLLPPKGLAVLVTPIDDEAPKGRIKILQVQAIRELLDNNKASLVVKETEYAGILQSLNRKPDLVVCDSPVIEKVSGLTPKSVPVTTFSILLSRHKGDLAEQTRGVLAINELKDGDTVLIAEACSHHPVEDDIGRIKIPRLLKEYTGKSLTIEICAGRDYPEDLSRYALIIHCGGCMLTRKEMVCRIEKGIEHSVPVTNYGICISFLKGVLEEALKPFPQVLKEYQQIKEETLSCLVQR